MDLRPSVQRRLSATEYAVRALRKAIEDGRIRQGDRLREDAIARALDVGRATVREATRQLVQEGIAEHRLHEGAFVRILTGEDRLDVFVAREAIEGYAAQQIIEAEEPPDLTMLERALGQMPDALGDTTWSSPEVIEADIDFHRRLVAAARSARLSRVYETLATESLMLLVEVRTYPADPYADQHAAILAALRRRDARAPDLVREHLQLSSALIRDEWDATTLSERRIVDNP